MVAERTWERFFEVPAKFLLVPFDAVNAGFVTTLMALRKQAECLALH